MKVGTKRYLCFSPLANFLLLNVVLWIASPLSAVSDWTVLVYVQANNNLSQFAEKNFTDMATIGSTEKLNILVEWHHPGHKGTWRYKIDQGKMNFDSCIETESDGNHPKDLVNAMQWATTKYPSKQNALVLWDHGIGIIDPVWGKYRTQPTNYLVNPTMVSNNPRIQINGLTTTKKHYICKNSNTLKTLPCTYVKNDPNEIDQTRGILFNEYTKTYMTNEILATALSDIKTNVMNGKKIDLLGMDACLMAMVEVAYQTRNYANILVASEEVELAHGWHYSSFLNILKSGAVPPMQLAEGIVHTYQRYYKDRVQFYTQSATDLGKIDNVKKGLDEVVLCLNHCYKNTQTTTKNLIKKSRSNCLQFSAPNYVDVHSFCTEVLKQLNNPKDATTYQHPSFTELKKYLEIEIKLIEDAVIAYTAGKYLSRARGLSIYYPTGHIDLSYLKTDFAKESLWVDFLRNYI